MSERRPLRARLDLRAATTTSVIRPRRLLPRAAPQQAALPTSAIALSFSQVLLFHDEIGTHRGPRTGLGKVFDLDPLRDVPFLELARLVRSAYRGKRVPPHEAWPAQREALRWFVDQGTRAIYDVDERKPIRVKRARQPQRFYLLDGHHRALALYVLGERQVRVTCGPGT